MAQDYRRQPQSAPQADIDQEELVQVLAEELAQLELDELIQAEAEPESAEGNTRLMEACFFALSKIKYVILAALVGALLAGLFVQRFVSPLYEATSKLYILNTSGLQINMGDLNVASELTMDYQEVFKTWEVHEAVRDELRLEVSNAELQSMLTVTNPPDTRLLYVSIRHTDPILAAEIANAYARAARAFILRVMTGEEPNEFSIALVPSTTVNLGRTHFMLLGFLVGAVLSVGVIMLLFILDDQPHTPDDVSRAAGIPTLAVMPREKNMNRKSGQRKVRKA